jgi:uncharacterized protein YndB with AHSA1/START domain/GNAT superfamily N-acetyltransferase
VNVSHELTVAAPPADVWRALTDPELTRHFYYDMRVESDFRPGSPVRYTFGADQEGETGVVLEVEPSRWLSVETRFVFDSALTAEPPHRTTWQLSRADAGTRVKVMYDVPEAAPLAARILRDDGAVPLRGLRLVVDPAARAELARLPEIGPVELRDLSPELVTDFQRFFDGDAFRDHPGWAFCYCSETNIGDSAIRTSVDNRAEMTRLVEAGEVTALLAYVGGRPVGWCNYGVTTRLAGVMSKLKLESADHDRVGSIACFVIASHYRRHGLAEMLLEAACARLAAAGCVAVEAYPRQDAESDASSYRGPLEMYLRAGFEPYREAGRTQIVRKRLA